MNSLKIMLAKTELSANITSKNNHIAIVGFGVSGLLTFLNIVKNYQKSSENLTIHIFEKSQFFPKGIAYSTKNINHLLNVPAYLMGVVDEDREDFFKWLISKGYNYKKNDFVPRQIFGIYLEDLLKLALKIADEKNISYQFLNKEISEIAIKDKHYLIDEDTYNYCIIAVGVRLKNKSKNFWHVDIKKYLHEKEIHISGCGLTAFDAAISLRDLNYEGVIFMHSRSGKMPQVHKIIDSSKKINPPLSIEDTALPLSLIFRKFVKNCKNSTDWRPCFDAIRPLTQDFWSKLNTEKKKRFTRHCIRLWNIHRHRCPESEFAAITKMIDLGKLVLVKKRSDAENVIDCTGFDYGFRSKLINNLIENGIVKFDDLELGIVSQYDNFYVIGGLNFGSIFEITAAPDIALQALKISRHVI